MVAAKPPTCSTCGAVMSGIGWSEELSFTVNFCPQCSAKEKTTPQKVMKPPIEMRMLDEAA